MKTLLVLTLLVVSTICATADASIYLKNGTVYSHVQIIEDSKYQVTFLLPDGKRKQINKLNVLTMSYDMNL